MKIYHMTDDGSLVKTW